MIKIPKTHPRYESLMIREKLIEGFHEGYVAEAGLIAHGRGECFDYLIGEETTPPAEKAIKAAAATMLLSKHPVISVNGNTAALVPKEMVELAKEANAYLEVNLFYRTQERVEKIRKVLQSHGASEVLGVDDASVRIPELESERRKVSPKGIWAADLVLIPLEDGDRAEALKKLGKKIIAIDLNPLSRTSLVADITIVDNVVRAMKKLVEEVKTLKNENEETLRDIVEGFNNEENLKDVLKWIKNRLEELTQKKLTYSPTPSKDA